MGEFGESSPPDCIMKNTLIALPLALSLLASCTGLSGKGPPLDELKAELDDLPLAPVALAEGDLLEPGVEGPLRIGIAPPLCSNVSGSTHFGETQRLSSPGKARFDVWTDDEREVIDRWCEAALASGQITHYEYLPSLIVDTRRPDLALATRAAGAARGLDAVVVARVGTTYWADPTALSVLDAAILPAMVIPSADFTAIALAEGAVVDVKTGYAYAIGAAEATYEKRAPALGGDAVRYQRVARLRGVESMCRRLAAGAGLTQRTRTVDPVGSRSGL